MGIAFGFSVSGTIIDDSIAPGGHFSHEMEVQSSPEDELLNFTTDVLGIDTYPSGVTMSVAAEKDDNPYTARPFLSISPASFLLEPGNSQKLLLEGDVPVDVGSGSRYAMVVIRSTTASSSNDSRVGVIGITNFPIAIHISGTNQNITGKISEVKIDKPISPSQQNVSVTLKNTGNSDFGITVKADLEDGNGEVLASDETLYTTSAIIPDTSRLFKLTLVPGEELKSGVYSINATAVLANETVLASKKVAFKI
jgi:hypothetical protein